ncbi:MAG: C1 family peptidase [Thiobacillus sp.]
MPTVTQHHRTFDARPDRIDLRDRVYQPRLVSLPPRWPQLESIDQHLPDYARALVLDQGEEGACTGFGLAAMINFLQWKQNGYQTRGLRTVSPRMLYHLARLYDEWPGEDYEGSSCRGAMKGWHRHGVCSEALWPYRNSRGKIAFIPPKAGWETDAASRPLGAYYRIDKRSLSDMQAAIYEVGAIYCSANVHKGWFLDKTDEPVILTMQTKPVGAHAFAIVGYTEDGFVVQNSWGPDWGYHGFALLAYEDWVRHGTDAWVAVLGAPMRTAASPVAFSTRPLQAASPAAGGAGRRTVPGEGFRYQNDAVRPLDEAAAYLHSLVLGNNGRPINRLIVAENAARAAEIVCVDQPAAWFDALPDDAPRKLAIYVHGGLNSEADSLTRIRMMAPYFRENGLYPLFVTWKTGPLESLRSILEDSAREVFRGQPEMRDEGVADRIRQALAEARDRSIEVACENLLVKPLWSEMKQNAAAAAFDGGGLALLARHLRTLSGKTPGLEIHLAGHSAGAIVLGHLLPLLDKQLDLASLTLFAPACTVDFANRHYGAAFQSGKLVPGSVHVDIMDDERERADTVGPYGKSLLYLVSRALETRHKTPILGMEYAWKAAPPDLWSSAPEIAADLAEWAGHAAAVGAVRLHGKRRATVSTGADRIKLAHGSFDNDIEVVADMLERMRGAALAAKVENLAY